MNDPTPTKITWDDLNDRRVDDRLKEEATVSSTATHYASATVNVPQVAAPSLLRRILFNALIYLPLLGALGGLAGWATGEAIVVRNDRAAEAVRLHADLDSIDRGEATGALSSNDAAAARARIRSIARDNRFFDRNASPDPALLAAESRAIFRADLITLGALGVGIAAMLAAAEGLFAARWTAATLDGLAGATIGAAGVAATIAVVRAAHAGSIDDADLLAPLAARIAGWTALGGVVGVAGGVASRSGRRALIGLLGGALAGAAVGSTFHLLLARTGGDAQRVRLIAALSVGVASGIAIALIERVARNGWLRVTQGPIAGKQFILYRNPTLLGSAPTSHIYLFRDVAVGKRHAAVFRVDKGFEIENLPLGGATLVNDVPITRTRLQHGDEISVGRTRFVFEERRR